MIQGLTAKDVELCNLLWNCDTLEDVDRMVAAMPPAYKDRARVLRELMIADQLDTIEHVDAAVAVLLKRISRA
jgi:hypothetical protein